MLPVHEFHRLQEQRMKIVLISIIHSFKYGNTGIDYIANYLRRDNRDIIETRYFHRNECTDDIMAGLPIECDLYGFSIFETNYIQSREIATKIKKKNKDAIIVFGGKFVSMNYASLIDKCNDVDYFIVGDGEAPLKRIIEHHKNRIDLLRNDPNIALNNDLENKIGNREQDINRSSDLDYFINDTEENNSQKTHCIMTKSNICTGNCSFCCSTKGKAIYKNTERIVSEISILSEKYGVKRFFLTDDDIFDFDNDENRYRLY